MLSKGFICCLASFNFLFLAGCVDANDDGSQEPQADAEAVNEQSIPNVAAITHELNQGNLGKAAEMATAATKANPSDPALLILLARIEARRQNVGDAIAALRSAFAQGFHDPRGALNHPDFDGIRGEEAFITIVAQFAVPAKAARKPAPAPVSSSSIRAGDVSIVESVDGHSRIRAGDIEIRD